MSRHEKDYAVYDLTGLGCPLPLALARSAGAAAAAGDPVVSCSGCGVRYFTRPKGSPLAENGLCRACATEAERQAAANADRHVTPFQRPARGKGARR